MTTYIIGKRQKRTKEEKKEMNGVPLSYLVVEH